MSQTFKLLTVLVILSVGFVMGSVMVEKVLAVGTWTAAPASPPSNNVDAPINAGLTDQTKLGPLTISGGLAVLTKFIFNPTGQPVIEEGLVLTSIDEWGSVGWRAASGGSTGGGPTDTDVDVQGLALNHTVSFDMTGYSVASGRFGGYDSVGDVTDIFLLHFTFNKNTNTITYVFDTDLLRSGSTNVGPQAGSRSLVDGGSIVIDNPLDGNSNGDYGRFTVSRSGNTITLTFHNSYYESTATLFVNKW